MTAFLWKLVWWALGLMGIGKPESEAHRAERLTRDAERARQERDALRANIAADKRRQDAEARLGKLESAIKGRSKVKPGGPLFALPFALILCTACIGLVQMACAGISVKEHRMFMYPSTWEIVDRTTGAKVGYYNGDCCCVGKRLGERVRDGVKAGTIDRAKFFSDEAYQKETMERICLELGGQP